MKDHPPSAPFREHSGNYFPRPPAPDRPAGAGARPARDAAGTEIAPAFGMSFYRSTDYREIVLQLVADRKKLEPKFNYAQLALKIGVQKTYISRVLSGDRDFSSDQLHAIGRFFALDSEAVDYLLLLLEYARTGYAWRKRDLHRKISQIQVRQRNIKKALQADVLEPLKSEALTTFYLDPINSVVHHFFDLPAYQKDPARIGEVLGLTPGQLQRVTATLLAAGILRRSAQTGVYSVAREHIHLDHDSRLSLPYLVALRHLSAHQIQRVPKDEQMTFSVTFSTDEKTRVFIHECFLNFLKEIEPTVRASPSEEIYQINFDLFPWAINK